MKKVNRFRNHYYWFLGCFVWTSICERNCIRYGKDH